MKEFKGKTAFITGAANGIGAEYSRECARRGMNVAMLDINKDSLTKTEDEIKALGAKTLAIKCDITAEGELRGAIRKTVETFGTLDLIFNNAGVYFIGDITQVPIADVRWMFDVNVFPIFVTMQEAIPIMEKQGTPCHIVNAASLAGMMTNVASTAYQATKHAVVALSESAYLDLRKKGSNVGLSVFCPGYVNTGLHKSWENKPDKYGKDNPYYESTDFSKNASKVEKFVTNGLPLEVVAPITFEGIESEQFYIIPERDFDGFLLRRHDNIMKRINPDLKNLSM